MLNSVIDTDNVNFFSGIPKAINLTDINNDQLIDIILGYEKSNRFSVIVNNGLGNFGPILNIQTQNQNSIIAKITTGDINNDNYQDIITSDYSNKSLGVYLNNQNNTFSEVILSNTTENSVNAEISDFDNNGVSDVAIFKIGTNSVELYFNSTFLQSGPPQLVYFLAISTPINSIVKDINQDGFLDLIVVSNSEVNYLQNDGFIQNGELASFSNLVTSESNQNGFTEIFVVGDDFNKDGYFEVLGVYAEHANFVSIIKDIDQDKIGDNTETLLGINPNNPDSDADGILDGSEIILPSTSIDTDLDGIIDALDTDDDNDGILTSIEVAQGALFGVDIDGDGIPNYLDTDSDKDGILDSVEGDVDADGTGIPDFLEVPAALLDKDFDGYIDVYFGGNDCDDVNPAINPAVAEIPFDNLDNNCNGIIDEIDTDGDGLYDTIEFAIGTDPNNLDSDGDTILDGQEYNDELNYFGISDIDGDGLLAALDTDSDADGILDNAENADTNANSIPDYLEAAPVAVNKDADGDGFINYVYGGSDCDDSNVSVHPYAADSDQIADGLDNDCNGATDDFANDLDSDQDGISDNYEVNYFGFDPFDPDMDDDGILDGYEMGNGEFYGQDLDGDGLIAASDSDSDGDGILDIIEGIGDSDGDGIPNYLDPSGIVVLDTDGDGILDSDELALGLDPNNTDSDADGVPDGIEITLPNIAFDTDLDGIIDALDTDDDNDGILTSIEVTDATLYGSDVDFDGIAQYLDLDSDGDGILDVTEGNGDNNANGIPNYLEICTKPLTAAILGSASPCAYASSTTYYVTSTLGSSYTWTVPTEATILSGDGTAKIKVRFNNLAAGDISVTETNAEGCKGDAVLLSLTATPASYEIPAKTITCKTTQFTIPILATSIVNNGIIGMNISLNYDSNVITATGIMSLGNVVTAGNTGASYAINTATPGKILINIYFNSSLIQQFNGLGTVVALNFRVLQPLAVGAIIPININQIREGYALGNALVCAKSGEITVTEDYTLYGSIKLRNSATGLGYNSSNPNRFLVTSIVGVNELCEQTTSTVFPDINGNFSIDLANTSNVILTRDIAVNTNVNTYINATDALRATEIAVGLGTVPSVYEVLAADVNGDGFIVGDNTLIMQRSTRTIPQFGTGRDWVFFDSYALTSDPNFSISVDYPFDDELGFSAQRVPQVAACLPYRRETDGLCTYTPLTTFIGVLLGDVNGNFNNNINSRIRSEQSDEVVIDLTKASVIDSGYMSIPVYLNSLEARKTIDFVLDYNQIDTKIKTVTKSDNGTNLMWNDFQSDSLLLSAYNLNAFASDAAIFNIVVKKDDQMLFKNHFSNTYAIVDDKFTNVRVEGVEETTDISSSIAKLEAITIYPNPTSSTWTMNAGNWAIGKDMMVFNSTGVLIHTQKLNAIYTKVETILPSGIYLVKVGNQTKKLVIE